MRENKRKRLEAKGWRIGTTKDFLDLSPEEKTLIELRLTLAKGLKNRRIRSRLTQVDLAKAVQSSQSRVAKMEAGDPSVSIDLLVRSLIALGASSKELATIISSSRDRSAT
jgi:DNA-binding XRE family transcriptional regulator